VADHGAVPELLPLMCDRPLKTHASASFYR
jgi:hypothetical protein